MLSKLVGFFFFNKIGLPSLTYSQIWLIPLVDDLQVWQHQKFEKKRKKRHPGTQEWDLLS
jgi:hypothetical protein